MIKAYRFGLSVEDDADDSGVSLLAADDPDGLSINANTCLQVADSE